MKIIVYSSGFRRGVSFYGVVPERQGKNGNPYPKDSKRLWSLRSRIEAMAQRLLGANFVEVEDLRSMLVLCVKVGTSSGPKKFALRELCGWIALCDLEPTPS